MKAAILTREEARARSRVVADVDYVLSFELEEGEGYRGEARVTYRLEEGCEALWLDYAGRRVAALEVDGEELPPSAHDGRRVELPARAREAGVHRVRVAFESAYDHDGAGLHEVEDAADGRRYLFTHFEPFDANRLFPCFDQPDLRAHFTVTVSAPTDWVVIGNGRILSTRDEDERRVHHFERLGSYSTYLFALCAGPFATWTDPRARIPSRLLCTQALAGYLDVEELELVTRQGFGFYERWFESAYPFPKYDQVFVPDHNIGAMENVGCVILNADHLIQRRGSTGDERERRAEIVLHEMAHMWFGDLVTVRWWDETWLKESFATYMAYLAMAEGTPHQGAWESFQNEMKARGLRQDELPTRHPVLCEVTDTDMGGAQFDDITYGKGAAALKQLVAYLGPETFRRGVVSFLQEHAWKAATLADFLRSLARVAEQDLAPWCRVWLETAGTDLLEPRVELSEGRLATLTVLRGPACGEPVERPHQFTLALWNEDDEGRLASRPRRVPVRVEAAETRVEEVEGERAPAIVFLDHGDDACARVLLDEGSLAWARAHPRELRHGHLRLAVWHQLAWEVREARRAPAELLEHVLAAARHEPRASSLSHLKGHFLETTDLYLPSAAQEEWVPRLAACCRELATRAGPAADVTRVWFDLLVRWSRTDEDLDRLAAALLEPPTWAPWLAGDQDRRWQVVKQLSAFDHPDAAARLAEEEARDGGNRGRRAALACAAARPDPESKAAMWTRLVEDTETPLPLLRAAMSAFAWPHQGSVLEPYARAYFEELPRICRERERPFVGAFTERLFPACPPREASERAAREVLESDGALLPSARRELAEQVAELSRALASQRRWG